MSHWSDMLKAEKAERRGSLPVPRPVQAPGQDLDGLTVAELKALLEKAGAPFPSDARKAELRDMAGML